MPVVRSARVKGICRPFAEVRQEFFDKDRQSKPVTRAREKKIETSGPDVEDELPHTAREREVSELGGRGR